MYKTALQYDPTLWCAFERLCRLQIHTTDPSKVFNENHTNVVRMNTIIRDYMQSVTIPNQQSPQQHSTMNPPPPIFTKSQMPTSNPNIGMSNRSPVNQDMKENMSAALKRQQNLNITNEDISLGVSAVHMDEDSSSYNELKTPTGQPSGHYITPTSNMNLV